MNQSLLTKGFVDPKGFNLDSISIWNYSGAFSQKLDEEIKFTKWGLLHLFT